MTINVPVFGSSSANVQSYPIDPSNSAYLHSLGSPAFKQEEEKNVLNLNKTFL